MSRDVNMPWCVKQLSWIDIHVDCLSLFYEGRKNPTCSLGQCISKYIVYNQHIIWCGQDMHSWVYNVTVKLSTSPCGLGPKCPTCRYPNQSGGHYHMRGGGAYDRYHDSVKTLCPAELVRLTFAENRSMQQHDTVHLRDTSCYATPLNVHNEKFDKKSLTICINYIYSRYFKNDLIKRKI